MLTILTHRKHQFEPGFCKKNNLMMLKYLIQNSAFRYYKNYVSLRREAGYKS